MLTDIEHIIGYKYLCVLLDIIWITDESKDISQDGLLDTVNKLNCQLEWPGQIGFIIVSLYVLLRAN